MSRTRLYIILFLASITAYIYIIYNFLNPANNLSQEYGFCIFKHVTGIPCPSCGSTRSILSIINGDLYDGLLWNPIGFLLLLILTITPLWLLIDIIFKKESLYRSYLKAEQIFKRKYITIPSILFLMIIWIWNIFKGV